MSNCMGDPRCQQAADRAFWRAFRSVGHFRIIGSVGGFFLHMSAKIFGRNYQKCRTDRLCRCSARIQWMGSSASPQEFWTSDAALGQLLYLVLRTFQLKEPKCGILSCNEYCIYLVQDARLLARRVEWRMKSTQSHERRRSGIYDVGEMSYDTFNSIRAQGPRIPPSRTFHTGEPSTMWKPLEGTASFVILKASRCLG